MNRNWKISQYCENPPKYDLSNYQDACANYTEGEVSVMALCAGASTGMHSHIGASCVAEFSAKYFAEHFDAFYNAEFNTACAELTNYHQAMISHLAGVAFERKNVQILVGRTIQIKELNKFACGVQILAVKDDKAVYFKIGNGSAAIASDHTIATLSDSVHQPTDVFITTPNPIFVLINCDFKTFTISPSCNAISLATDGVEFEGGLFFEHEATPFYQKLLEDICDAESDPEEELRKTVIALFKDNMNTEKDNIGISVMYREPLEETESEISVEESEEIPEEDQIPLVEIDDDVIDELPMSEIIEETSVEETEAIIEEAPVEEVEAIVEETPVEEADEIIEEVPVEEAEEIVEEAPVEEAEAIIEEAPVEETEEIIEEVPVEEADEIIEEVPVEEADEIIEEEPVEEADEIIEEAPVEETEAIIEEEPVEEAEEIIEETPVTETPTNDFETSFFPEEDEKSVEMEIPEKKPKISVKTDKMKASIGTKTVSEEKPAKKSSKIFKFFNISVSKK